MRREKQNKRIPFTKTAGDANVIERLRFLNAQERHAALATDAGGRPYLSLVAYALTPEMDGALFATPKKTTKYRNILENSNVSLLIDTRSNTAEGYMSSEAATIVGNALLVRRGRRRDELARLFVRKHPRLSEFVAAPSTALILIKFQKVIHTGEFQKVTEWMIH